MKRIGETVKTSVVRNFLEGGRPEKWTPLSPKTLKKKRNKGRVLMEETHLMNSVSWKATARSVEVGTNKVYAAIHQFGGEAGRKSKRVTIPARPYLLVQDEDIAEIRASITAHIMAAEKGGR